jgi:hypothetical protein
LDYLPILCLQCKLDGIAPVGGTYSQEFFDLMYQKFSDQPVDVVVTHKFSEPPVPVTLTTCTHAEPPVNIADFFVKLK